MTVFLRKHFWLINLVTISLCAFFSARAVGRLVESSITSTDVRPPSPSPRTMHQPSLAPLNRDIASILDRNIFCSTCEKVVEGANNPAEGNGEGIANDTPVKTSLNLKLIATLVSEDDKSWSFAAILDGTENKTGMYAIGSKIAESTTLTDILDRRVLMLNGNRHEYLDLEATEEQRVAAGAEPKPTPTIARPGSPLGKLEEEVSKSIRMVGDGKYELERAALEKVLGNTTLLARSARIVPSVRNGKPDGFKLYAIRPGSIYSMLGMMNGDTINAINGHPMTTPDKALEVYTKLRNASHLSISFSRGGAAKTHEYTIR